MLILDTLSIVKNGKLEIPFYHKGHLSLKSNTQVTVCLIPQSNESNLGYVPEMIISPIKFNSWPFIWRINAVFKERQGIVHKLLTIVRDAELNVLTEESSSVENRSFHQVELIVDASEAYGDIQDRQDMLEAIDTLERRIIALCIDELVFLNGQPRINVRQMKGLYFAHKRYTESFKDRSVARPKVERAIINMGFLQIPDGCMDILKKNIPLRALQSSDTTERILRVLFPPPDIQFTFVRISHLDSKGALAKITGELAQAFDIVTSLTRIQSQGTQNDFELLLYSKQYSNPSEEEIRRKIIDNVLSNSKFDSLQLRITYPGKVRQSSAVGQGKSPKGQNTVVFSINNNIPQISEEELRKSTSLIIKETIAKYSKLKNTKMSFSIQKDFDSRYAVLDRLLLEEDVEAKSSREIFISYQFSLEALFEQTDAVVSELDCRTVSGRDPNEQPVFRTVIINRIKAAQGFVGIWTGKDSLISPWLVWELGVAQALGKPYRLFIHNSVNTDVWKPINPEKNHTVFSDLNFLSKIKTTIPHLIDEIHTIERAKLWRG